MNEGERRLLDVVKANSYISTFADPNKTVLGLEYYAYSIDKVALALNETAELDFPLIMDSDSDFVIMSLCAGAVVSAPAIADPTNGNRIVEYSPSIVLQILNESSGKTFWDSPTPLPLVCGTGGFPYQFVSPRVIRPRTTIQVSVQGVVPGPVFSAFYFTMHGAKIYYAS